MSIVEPDRPTTRRFLTVVCPCGRSLRASPDMAGGEISCWECHRKVRVPFPRSAERAFRIISDGLRDVFEPRWLFALFLGAALLTGALCLSEVGLYLATAVLFLGALGYGEVIRQCGIGFWDFDDWKRPGQLIRRVGVAALFALGLAAPLWLSVGGSENPPRFSTLGFLVGLVGTAALPLAMFLVYARDDSGPLSWRRGGGLLLRYPVATCLALAVLPVGVIAAELALVVVSSWQGMFPFLILDLFPGSEYFASLYNIPKYGNYTKPQLPDPEFFHLYLRRVRQGYVLTTAIPASLSIKTFVLKSPWTLELSDSGYLMTRAWYNQVSTTVLLLFLAIQSRWLGAISSLDTKRVLESNP